MSKKILTHCSKGLQLTFFSVMISNATSLNISCTKLIILLYRRFLTYIQCFSNMIVLLTKVKLYVTKMRLLLDRNFSVNLNKLV